MRIIQLCYSKLLVCLWGLILIVVSAKQGYLVQSAVGAIILVSIYPTQDCEVKLLIPYLMLAERCMITHTSIYHSPVPFYASALAVYCINTSSCSRINEDNKASVPFRIFEVPSTLYGLAGAVSFGVLTQNWVHGLSVAAYVSASLIAFHKLRICLTEREAVLVASLIGLLFFDAVSNTALDPENNVAITNFPHIGGRCALLASLMTALVASWFSAVPDDNNMTSRTRSKATYQFIITATLFIGIAFSYCFYAFDENPLQWLSAYLISSQLRARAVALWAAGIPIMAALITLFGDSFPKIIQRKLFHLLAVVAFLPVAVNDPEFLGFSTMIAVSIGILLETARCCRIYGTSIVSAFVELHIDERDGGGKHPVKGAVVRTHLYLILGCSISIILNRRQLMVVPLHLAPSIMAAIFIVPGIISLGVLDAMAAVVGSHITSSRLKHEVAKRKLPIKLTSKKHKEEYEEAVRSAHRTHLGRYFCTNSGGGSEGVFPLSLNNSLRHKTIEGTIAGLLSAVTMWVILVMLGFAGGPINMSPRASKAPPLSIYDQLFTIVQIMIPSLAGIIFGAVAEATTEGIDNLELPIFVSGVIQTAVAVLNLYLKARV
eukprot:Tbor_TRINITY_DN4229_c0_g1::TRINITY_DN4229_c0_g1_i1::g.24026::m.24026/K00902/E2.7.1.108; dolichol kinase